MNAVIGFLGAIFCILLGVAIYGAIVYCYIQISFILQEMKKRRAKNRIIRRLKKYQHYA